MSNFEDWFKTIEDELSEDCNYELHQYSAKDWLRDAFEEGTKYGRTLAYKQISRDSVWE